MTAYSAAVLADSPAGYWRLGETSGTAAADSSGNGHGGTYVNTPTLGVTGLVATDANRAVHLANASTQYVDTTLTADPTATDLTFEVWIKASSLPASTLAVVQQLDSGGTGRGVIFVTTSDSTHWFLMNNFGGTAKLGSVAIQVGKIVHAVFTWAHTAGAWAFYVNGVLDTSGTGATADVDAGAFRLGASKAPASGWDGDMDEVAIYTSALSGARIAAHYSAGIHGRPPAPTSVITTGSVRRASIF